MSHGSRARGEVEGDGGVNGDVGVLVVAEGISLCHFGLGEAEDFEERIEHFVLFIKVNKKNE